MTLGPIEPSMTGNSNDLPVALSVNVTVPAGAMTLVLLPSIEHLYRFARLSLDRGGCRIRRRIGRRGRIIKRRSDFAMQYRKCENSTRAPGRVGDAAEAFVLAERLHDFKDPGRCRGAGQGCPKRLRDRAKLSFFAIGKIA